MGRGVVTRGVSEGNFVELEYLSGVSPFSLTSRIRNTLVSCIVTLSARKELKKFNAYLTLLLLSHFSHVLLYVTP